MNQFRARLPLATNLALIVIASPPLRCIAGRLALKHLYTCVLTQPQSLAFVLFSRLGTANDPVFVWYILDLLLRVPENLFADKWISLTLLPVEDLPGATVRERITLSQVVITKIFGLWNLPAQAARVRLDYDKIVPPTA